MKRLKGYAIADEDYTVTEFQSEFEATKIYIQADNRILKFISSSDSQYSIKYYQAEYDKVTYTEEGGVISIIAKYDKKLRWAVRQPSREVRTIVVQVPDTFGGEIDANTSNGSVSVENLAALKSLTLNTLNGKIEAKGLTVSEHARLKTSNGAISIDALTVKNGINAKNSNGKITITSTSAAAIDAYTSNGDVEMKKIICDNISAKTSNGSVDITLYGQQQSYEIDVDTSNGSIVVDGLKIAKQIINGGAAKKLRAETSNGSINIDFL